jgi:hypothetical protein
VNQELSDVLNSKIRVFSIFPGSVTGKEPNNERIAQALNFLVTDSALDSSEVTFCVDESRFMTMNKPGTPEPYRYYSKLQVKSVITAPAPGEIVPTGGYTLTGVAWSGEEDIEKVEISADGGETWSPVDILHPRVGYSWSRWEHRWNPPATGTYTLMCRATNAKGETQPLEFPNPWDGRGYGNNMVFPYEVVVGGKSSGWRGCQHNPPTSVLKPGGLIQG